MDFTYICEAANVECDIHLTLNLSNCFRLFFYYITENTTMGECLA